MKRLRGDLITTTMYKNGFYYMVFFLISTED